MLRPKTLRSLRRHLSASASRVESFKRDERGIVAVIFGVLAIPAVVLAGGTVDYARANRVSAILQSSLDVGALAAASSLTLDNAGMIALAQDAAISNFNDGFHDAGSLQIDAAIGPEGEVVVSGSFALETHFLGLISMDEITVARRSVAVRPTDTIEIAVSADVSSSMDGHLGALRSSFEVLLTSMETVQRSGATVKISLVPYNHTVKPGKHFKEANWMDRDGRSPQNATIFSDKSADRFAMFDELGVEWEGCVIARDYPHDVNVTPAIKAKPETLFVPWFAPDEEGQAATQERVSGSDRGADGIYYFNNYLDDSGGSCTGNEAGSPLERVCKYTGQPVSLARRSLWNNHHPIGPNLNCPVNNEVMPLTERLSDLRPASRALTPAGYTDLISGFMWSWHTLTNHEPYAQAAAPAPSVRKYIIMMTDGANTYMPLRYNGYNGTYKSTYSTYEYLGYRKLVPNPYSVNGSSINAAMNARFLEACTNAKAADIVVWTVGFRLSDMSWSERKVSRDILSSCATERRMFIEANTAQDLITAYKEIAEEIAKVRLAE